MPTLTRRVLALGSTPDQRQLASRAVAWLASVSGPAAVPLFGEGDSPDALASPSASFQLEWAESAAEVETLHALAQGLAYGFAVVVAFAPRAGVGEGWEALTETYARDASPELVIVGAAPDGWADKQVGRPVLLVDAHATPAVLGQAIRVLADQWALRRIAAATREELECRVTERTNELLQALSRIEEETARREEAEIELRHAQKLEAMGRLAAGIAHEVNTPMQYLGDNLGFLATAAAGLPPLIRRYREAINAAATGDLRAAQIEDLVQAEQAMDLAFALEQLGPAVAAAQDAAARVTEIVRSMKELSHPGGKEPVPIDLRHLVECAVAIARTETKHVSRVVVTGEIPGPVPCHAGDLGQVILNLLVNAAHALKEAGRTPDTGQIEVRLSSDERTASIEVLDNGNGVPPEIRERVFEPFFTTKGVGKGTGQGLALARSVVADRHRGTLMVEDAPGGGALFRIGLPLAPPEA